MFTSIYYKFCLEYFIVTNLWFVLWILQSTFLPLVIDLLYQTFIINMINVSLKAHFQMILDQQILRPLYIINRRSMFPYFTIDFEIVYLFEWGTFSHALKVIFRHVSHWVSIKANPHKFIKIWNRFDIVKTLNEVIGQIQFPQTR